METSLRHSWCQSHDREVTGRRVGRDTARWLGALAVWLLLVLTSTASLAQRTPHSGAAGGSGAQGATELGRSLGAPAHQHLDGRYAHDQYYYDHGYTLTRPPAGGIGNLRAHDGGRYWYDQGNWYLWNGGAWIVWAAPLWVFIPWLPPYYTTLWWYGIPYYYANDTYYVWNDMEQSYEVVPPPPGISQAAPDTPRDSTVSPPYIESSPPPAAEGAPAMIPGYPPAANHRSGSTAGDIRLFAYPRNGQSEQQQAADRAECQHWAMMQSGFDPSVRGGGVPAEEWMQKRSDYIRAQVSCLEGRGYTAQ